MEIAAPPSEAPRTPTRWPNTNVIGFCARVQRGGTSPRGVIPIKIKKGNATKPPDKGPPGPGDWREVFCRYIVRNGRVIYPTGAKVFHFWVRVA